ncbi:hypothetical protein [Pseudonocardia pini]|uniref:hypothetical protein n=1 Tax=Pseudonocardia pini TaxID=2758030 RepID=UPI0015F01F28|nr:hypothetical protein [Pseudonocardia pini]
MTRSGHVRSAVRELDEAEVREYRARGHVVLRGLVDPGLVAAMLEAATAWMAFRDLALDETGVAALRLSHRDDALFASVATAENLGAAAARLLDHAGTVRLLGDAIGWAPPRSGTGPVPDVRESRVGTMLDRPFVALSIALAPITVGRRPSRSRSRPATWWRTTAVWRR